MNQPKIEFRPLTPTSQDDFNVFIQGHNVGTFFWKRNHPKPEDKVCVVRDLDGNVFVGQNETQAITWFIKGLT